MNHFASRVHVRLKREPADPVLPCHVTSPYLHDRDEMRYSVRSVQLGTTPPKC